MPNGARSASGNPAARQISLAFGLIADTLEWPNSDYQSLIARLHSVGKDSLDLTLRDVLEAIWNHSAGQRVSTDGRTH